MKPKFIKAGPHQKAAYKGLYPLHGFAIVGVNGGQLACYIEDLRGSWSRPDPVWETRFPEGWNSDGCHGLLASTLEEAIENAGCPLTRCVPGGGCGCSIDIGGVHLYD